MKSEVRDGGRGPPTEIGSNYRLLNGSARGRGGREIVRVDSNPAEFNRCVCALFPSARPMANGRSAGELLSHSITNRRVGTLSLMDASTIVIESIGNTIMHCTVLYFTVPAQDYRYT